MPVGRTAARMPGPTAERSPGLTARALACLAVLLIAGASCARGPRIDLDPESEAFFETARLIMTDEEIRIFRYLPDEAARREFIAAFWLDRDPDRATDENEAREEFDRRVEYARKWFGRRVSDRRASRRESWEKDTGWSTDRGRIYVVMGPPDALIFSEGQMGAEQIFFDEPEDRWIFDRFPFEYWYYTEWDLSILFIDGALQRFDSLLRQAMEESKANWLPGGAADNGGRLKFEAEFRDGRLLLEVPVSRLQFKDDDGGRLKGRLAVRLLVYKDGVRREPIESAWEIDKDQDELLETKKLEFELPVELAGPGEYTFDVLLEDEMALMPSRYRVFIKHTRR